jgi:hypothetical protein
MYDLDDLGLTPNQMIEVKNADPILVAAWLERVDDPTIDNPVAWFLTGVRSGVSPNQLADQHRFRAIKRAEAWIVNAGLFCPSETDIEDELFDGVSAMLRHYAGEEPLREKMLALYRLERPRGEQVERESEERAERHRNARRA